MCPPGVDQTMRSPQQWLLYAPELEQRHAFTKNDNDWGTTFTDISSGTVNFNVWALLARPIHSSVVTHPVKSSSHFHRGRFNTLSNELIDMILSYISSDPSDMIALGLTCESFWYLVAQHIHRCYLKSAAPWAGAKIIFQGSYATELPEFLVDSPAVLKADAGDRIRMPPARQIFWTGWCFKKVKSFTSLEEEWLQAIEMWKGSSGIPEQRWREMMQHLDTSYLFPRDHPWVLRNLTKKEFVSSKVPERRRTRGGKDCSETTFEEVLLMKTFWKAHPPYVHYDKECRPSKWAGHCFDIVREDVHVAEGGEGWKDLTVSVERDVMAWKMMQESSEEWS
ncbi:hypothetical protein ONS95_003459 [Cadophora gregata]|uniref:uncharacterized protein n=1 Tax=Cadophora gregata TaxID=51156 RepID=UPI0026DB1FAD|nr:uncharacterized protein ONS95_003459 [Cadophora gregata]KAK0108668.1 hypothetical protein ONS95_003459 [Cadophora gregata]KAK0108742.1 hypothetical protein ONS96_002587 [Cadophora gregata f. sp. sojae]